MLLYFCRLENRTLNFLRVKVLVQGFFRVSLCALGIFCRERGGCHFESHLDLKDSRN